MAPEFTASEPYRGERPRVLALYCSDGRFTRAVEELAASRGHGAVDTLTLPGGPALFSYAASYSDRDAVRRAAQFQVRAHGVRFVILVAHQGCGYHAERHARESVEERERRQVADLRDSARAIRRLAPGLAIEAYFARVNEERVTFEAVETGSRS